MRMTLNEVKQKFADRPAPAPSEYAGQWVAWNQDRTRIVAHGAEFESVRRKAISDGCTEPLMQRVLGSAFVGGA